AALLDQAERTELTIAAQPLVPRLPRDAELIAKRREIAAFLRGSLDELKFQTHGALLFPGHPSFEYRQRCPDTFVSAMSWYSTGAERVRLTILLHRLYRFATPATPEQELAPSEPRLARFMKCRQRLGPCRGSSAADRRARRATAIRRWSSELPPPRAGE